MVALTSPAPEILVTRSTGDRFPDYRVRRANFVEYVLISPGYTRTDSGAMLYTVRVCGGGDRVTLGASVVNPRPIVGFREIAWRKAAAVTWARRFLASKGGEW